MSCICCQLAADDRGRPLGLTDGLCCYCAAELKGARMPRETIGLFALLEALFCRTGRYAHRWTRRQLASSLRSLMGAA